MLLDIPNVAMSFGGVTALRDVSFSVREGEILGLIGPNGAGKTTLFHVLTSMVSGASGDIVVRGGPWGGGAHPEEAGRTARPGGIGRQGGLRRLGPAARIPAQARDRPGAGLRAEASAAGRAGGGDGRKGGAGGAPPHPGGPGQR